MRTAPHRINPLLVPACVALLFLSLGPIPGLGAHAAESSPPPTSAPTSATATAGDADGKSAPAKPAKKKKRKQIFSLRVHVEAKRELPERCIPARVGRTNPLDYTVEKLPILTENHLQRAAIVEQPGGFLIRVRFDTLGAKILESYTAAAAGRHLLVVTDIEGEARWLAAPLVRQRLGDGTFAFTPDASREEAEQLVNGLNKDIEKAKKRWLAR